MFAALDDAARALDADGRRDGAANVRPLVGARASSEAVVILATGRSSPFSHIRPQDEFQTAHISCELSVSVRRE